jgi:hypothetical protein
MFDRDDKEQGGRVVGKKTMAVWLMVRMMVLDRIGKGQAQQRSARLLGVGYESVRHWYEDFVDRGYSFSTSLRGHHPKTRWLLDDQMVRQQAKEWVMSHARQRRQPNLTIRHFMNYLNQTLLPSLPQQPFQPGSILPFSHAMPCAMLPTDAASVAVAYVVSLATAHRYIVRLGFTVLEHSKSYFVDGHQRKDVIDYRQDYYLPKLAELSKRIIHTEPNKVEQQQFLTVPSSDRPIVIVNHDESVFYTKDEQQRSWHCKGMPKPMKQKSTGAGIMVSAYINEIQAGVLRVDDDDTALKKEDDAALQYLEIGKDQYWKSDLMVAQLKETIRIFKSRFPYAVPLFIFDWSPNHTKVLSIAS